MNSSRQSTKPVPCTGSPPIPIVVDWPRPARVVWATTSLVSDADRGREILERSGLAMIETDLVGVELPEGPQPLLRVCTALLQAELNIIQAYPLIVRPHGKPAVAIMVENIELAMETLKEKNFTIITEGDLDDNAIGNQ